MNRCNLNKPVGVYRPPRFSAWNTPLKAIPEGKGWGQPPADLTFEQVRAINANPAKRRERGAYHEVGHFLAQVAVGLLPHLEKVILYPGGGGEVILDPKMVALQIPEEQLLDTALMLRGGEMMEHAVYGRYNDPENLTDRAMARKVMQVYAQRSGYEAAERPQVVQQFVDGIEPLCTAHLKQFDRPVVDALARLLQDEGQWDRERIGQLVTQFRLDQVPTLKRTQGD